ncbi:restriction endonuclease subunit S [Thauera sp.]|jgi:type I restriction enzyme S subunit|uniref:restriction endonuclease subunit S n=1 Tax=Thauera sp. TaxID=1905334 RepID=UPI002A3662F4|nr:restriction endonuclease subunit S [Thauera sp.]MDX9885370.1 restriction endonuclease subunit S [Thauera sp.]
MSFPRYPEYKDSGVEWLGEVPGHWQVLPIRTVAKLESGHTPSRSRPDYWENCDVPWFTLADVWQIREGADYVFQTKESVSAVGLANSSARLLPAGTVILSRTASVGFSAIMGVAMATTQDFANWVCGSRVLPKYLLHTFRAMGMEFESLKFGSTHNTIYMPDIAAFRFALPSIEEQSAIVTYVDREVAKIDALVAEQQNLIALLKEKRQALISHAVTKGLDPDAPMKDSGVAWLGEVPAHWRVCSLRRAIAKIEQGWSPDCHARPAEAGEWGVLKAGCVNGGKYRPTENKALPSELLPDESYCVEVGDVLMSRASGSPDLVGSTALVRETPGRLMLSDKIFRLRLEIDVAPAFFVAMLNARALRAQIEQALSGGNGLANNLPQSNLLAFICALPPEEEQVAIAARLNRDIEGLDQLMAEAESTISLLIERRTALISAAVTGKIDVRHLAVASAEPTPEPA